MDGWRIDRQMMDGWLNSFRHCRTGIWINLSGRNPPEARRTSPLTDECAFQIPFYAEMGITHTHIKGQLHFKPNTEASWHIHTPLSWHRNTQDKSIDHCSLVKTLLSRNLCGSTVSVSVCFSWLSSRASNETCSIKQKQLWRQLLCCTAIPCCLLMWRKTEQTVVAVVKSTRHLLYHCSGCSSLFIFKVKSCKLAQKLSLSDHCCK